MNEEILEQVNEIFHDEDSIINPSEYTDKLLEFAEKWLSDQNTGDWKVKDRGCNPPNLMRLGLKNTENDDKVVFIIENDDEDEDLLNVEINAKTDYKRRMIQFKSKPSQMINKINNQLYKNNILVQKTSHLF